MAQSPKSAKGTADLLPSESCVPLSPKPRLNRAEKAAMTRDKLLSSAAAVVGEYGYREASVQRITSHAGIAQGTFYLYFESRQLLFDELLPYFGRVLLEHVRARAHGVKGFFEVEEIGVRAVFDYLQEHPWFWRVLNEAEVEAPKAWAAHHAEVSQRYVKFLLRAVERGEITGYSKDELGTLAYMLIAARDYLYIYTKSPLRPASAGNDDVIRTYMRFLRHGLKVHKA
ncbi:TetR/AcrR family transcriptional regulator [Acidovorax sp. Root70]|uniref:TetR/AcrR family transcriptional regulator n=1 Tax=Acidovorax sp. Root70 TaxID=1736590 RepID=UPI0019107149|nr:TetR/AcrR family transcriptional regulator [Acidovorax sp. Root70]